MNNFKLKILQPTTCPLHNNKLVEGKMVLIDNPPTLSDKYLSDRSNKFICSNLITCSEHEFSAINKEKEYLGESTEVPIHFCEVCREIEKKWLKKNSLFALTVAKKRNKLIKDIFIKSAGIILFIFGLIVLISAFFVEDDIGVLYFISSFVLMAPGMLIFLPHDLGMSWKEWYLIATRRHPTKDPLGEDCIMICELLEDCRELFLNKKLK